MNITKFMANKRQPVAVIDQASRLFSVQDILDVMVNAQYSNNCRGLVIYGESLGEAFFDLRSGFAGEVLQKFSNYNMKLAVIGDFSQCQSQSLRDFMGECNRGNRVFFKPSLQAGLEALTAL